MCSASSFGLLLTYVKVIICHHLALPAPPLAQLHPSCRAGPSNLLLHTDKSWFTLISRLTTVFIWQPADWWRHLWITFLDFLSLQKQSGDSAEVKIAKVAIVNVLLWICTWCPYACIVILGLTGQRQFITPLSSQIPSFLTKTASCLNPIVFAVSHPK